MNIFIGTLIIFTLSVLVLLIGTLLNGKLLRPGCGKKQTDCPNRCNKDRCPNKARPSITSPEA